MIQVPPLLRQRHNSFNQRLREFYRCEKLFRNLYSSNQHESCNFAHIGNICTCCLTAWR